MTIKPANIDQYLQTGCGRCKFGGTLQCKVHAWPEELRLLRDILRESGLTETIKWSSPCYTHEGKNILMLGAFKENVRVMFFRGAEMQDSANLLETPGENSRFARYIRIVDTHSIAPMKNTILSYIQEAIALENTGKRVEVSDNKIPEYPEELIRIFADKPDFAQAFAALTPGRQRGYLLYFSAAKQAKTRSARIETCMPKIFSGKGWNER